MKGKEKWICSCSFFIEYRIQLVEKSKQFCKSADFVHIIEALYARK